MDELVLFFEPFGLNVSSLLPRILKSAYSVVAIKLVALAPIAKIPAAANIPKEKNRDLILFFYKIITKINRKNQ
jgi:hypothetical protein